MSGRAFFSQTILYLFIISSGLQMGGAVFEALVTTPLWAGSAPESVTNWNPVAQYAVNPGLFWGRTTPIYALCSLLMLICAWFLPQLQRKWVLFASLTGLLIVAATAVFFVPILMKTIAIKGAGYSGEEITRMVNAWVNWNWLRLAAGLAAWLAAIRALSLSDEN